MKSYKNLYPQICEFANLYGAYRRARRGKRDRVAVASFEFDLEHNLLALQRELRDQSYRPGAYTNFYVREPKRRLISAAARSSNPSGRLASSTIAMPAAWAKGRTRP